MKPFILLLLLFLLAFETMASHHAGWIKLSSSKISQSKLIQNLRQLGHDYTLQKGIFQEKPKLPGGFWEIVKTESAYRKITKGITYYKFTVQSANANGPYLIRATYAIAFKPSNGDTIVKFHHYKIISKENEGPTPTDYPEFVDMRLLKKGSPLQKYLDEGIEFTVKDGVFKGWLPKSTYKFVRVFSIQSLEYTNPVGIIYFIQLVNQQGQNYRARIIGWANPEGPEGVPPHYDIYPNV